MLPSRNYHCPLGKYCRDKDLFNRSLYPPFTNSSPYILTMFEATGILVGTGGSILLTTLMLMYV